jgi:hypothetical protein
MDDYNHVQILNAYISRLTLSDINNIGEHVERCVNAQLNNSTPTQLKEQAGLYAAVCNTVNNLIKHDKNLINTIVNANISGTL